MVFRRNRMIFYHRSEKELLAHEMVLQIVVGMEFSRPIRGLERRAENSNIP